MSNTYYKFLNKKNRETVPLKYKSVPVESIEKKEMGEL
jgi:hypothetical protein